MNSLYRNRPRWRLFLPPREFSTSPRIMLPKMVLLLCIAVASGLPARRHIRFAVGFCGMVVTVSSTGPVSFIVSAAAGCCLRLKTGSSNSTGLSHSHGLSGDGTFPLRGGLFHGPGRGPSSPRVSHGPGRGPSSPRASHGPGRRPSSLRASHGPGSGPPSFLQIASPEAVCSISPRGGRPGLRGRLPLFLPMILLIIRYAIISIMIVVLTAICPPFSLVLCWQFPNAIWKGSRSLLPYLHPCPFWIYFAAYRCQPVYSAYYSNP
ncbi:hypothetical protein LX24_00440 [Desulfallas thermosapovorans DSM 6562]|uniref:Uncharacterized protein n=1 Tax=Desulfallas thermosapovorans DSM 6562 TaxID=1121431 RepID=A0A5S4ZWD2_9FIRM|nr:hypothetical protein LX24_00440 [Desulfallas thermosapovorans DSM 6562]